MIVKKYAVAFEPDIKQGTCHLARLEEGHGDVALFYTREQAQAWIDEGEDIDGSIFNLNILEIEVEEFEETEVNFCKKCGTGMKDVWIEKGYMKIIPCGKCGYPVYPNKEKI